MGEKKPSNRQCLNCNGTGRVTKDGKKVKCSGCGGKGYFSVRTI